MMAATAWSKTKSNLTVLVVTDGTSDGVQIITAYLDRNRYTVRAVALTELLRTPWEESAKAVIVPPPSGGGPEELASHEVNRLQKYCERGGKILSMHPQLNTAFGFPSPSTVAAEANPVVVIHCQQQSESASDKPFLESSAPLCSNLSVPTNDSESLLWEGGNQFTTCTLCTTPTTDEPIIRALSKAHKSSSNSSCGCVVLSYVDLCPDPRQFTGDPAVLQRLKETHLTRKKVLRMLLEHLDLQCHSEENPSYSLSYLLSSSPNSRAFVDAVRKSGGQPSYSVEVVERDDCGGVPVDSCPSESKLCILEDPSEGELAGMMFDRRKYFDELKTKSLGRTLLYTPVISSTQTLFERRTELVALLPDDVGLVSVAGRQTKGKGRHGTVWVSPAGCLMFTLALSIPPSSKLNMCADILCHVPAVAIVHSVRARTGYEALQLCIKWPDDIYYDRKAKVGGILVDLVRVEGKTVMLAGVGVNVTNEYPALSLADCINMHNAALSSSSSSSSSSHQLELISQEHLLAAILNTMEVLLQDLEETLSTCPLEDSLFCKLYYQYWMHSVPFNQVTLAATGQVALVGGITSKGHLLLQVEGTREVLTLETGRYTFDIFNKIIKVKQPV